MAVAIGACSASSPPLTTPFTDDFERAELGPHWRVAGGTWRIESGALRSSGDHNAALWLDVVLPRNVEVSFDATSASPAVDLKCELFGDGKTHQSGYIIINGGWRNSTSLIARLREHELDQVPVGTTPYKRAAGLTPGRTYHWRIVRRGNVITQDLDGERYLERDDPRGLAGPGHDRFGFNTWEAEVSFDNLRIAPL